MKKNKLNKKIKTAQKKIKKILKAVDKFINKTKINYKLMKIQIKEALCITIHIVMTILMTGCGVTKASISKPAAGTYTTITITTNNPITTDIKPETEVNL